MQKYQSTHSNSPAATRASASATLPGKVGVTVSLALIKDTGGSGKDRDRESLALTAGDFVVV